IALAADAVDDQRYRLLEHDLQDALRMGFAGEEGEHVELRSFGRGRGGRGDKQQHCPSGALHCRPASNASTTVGSARVEVSPKPSVAPSAILRRIRRMILPDRVLGSAGLKWIFSGAAMPPMSLRTSLTSSVRRPSSPTSPAFRVT